MDSKSETSTTPQLTGEISEAPTKTKKDKQSVKGKVARVIGALMSIFVSGSTPLIINAGMSAESPQNTPTNPLAKSNETNPNQTAGVVTTLKPSSQREDLSQEGGVRSDTVNKISFENVPPDIAKNLTISDGKKIN